MHEIINQIRARIKPLLEDKNLAEWGSRLFIPFIVMVVLTGFYFAMREKPVMVDLAVIEQGEMQVTIQEEGETRVRDIYMVSSHIAGHLDRTNLDEGESVKANKTIIASIHPLDPPLLDERKITELAAAVEAAKSAITLAEAEQQAALIGLELAVSEYERASKLSIKKIISERQLEKSLNNVKLGKAHVKSSTAKVSLRKAELASARARLKQPRTDDTSPVGNNCCIKLISPIDGVVLKVYARSRQAVSPGTKIAEIGDPANLEIIVDLLSRDAPKVPPGTKVLITEWGGEKNLEAVVRRIEPAAFTKISSLGIEEQRVNVVLDLSTVPRKLGAGYRILATLVIWKQDNIVQVPIGALFRSNGSWSVFVAHKGNVSLRKVEIGKMNNHHGQVLGGIKKGDVVVLYPNDQINDGSRVELRE